MLLKNDESVVYLLKRAELAVRSCAEAVLAPFGLTPTQFLILFQLKQAKGVSSADLARTIGVRPQSIVDLVGPLEREGLIKRKEDPEHRKILRITLTVTGEQLLSRALPVARSLELDLVSNLSAPEVAQLQDGLAKLFASAQAHETHPLARRSTAAAREPNARPRRQLAPSE